MADSSEGSVALTATITAGAVGVAGTMAAIDPELVQAAATFGGSALIAGSIVLLYSAMRRRGRSS